MYSAIIKNRLRILKGLLRHLWPPLIGIILVGGFVGVQAYFLLANGQIGRTLAGAYIFYLFLACFVLNTYRVFLKQEPIITMSAASLNHLYFTKHFKNILWIKYLLSFLIKPIIVSSILAGLISGFEINPIFIKSCILIYAYILIGSLLSWSRYHSRERRIQLTIILSHIIASATFLIEGGVVSVVLTYFLAMLWIYYVVFKLDFDLVKYSKDLVVIDEHNSAVSQFNMAKLLQLSAERQASKKKRIFLYNFPLKKNTAIFYKSIIELIRLGNQTCRFMAMLLIAGFVFHRTSIFSMIPILGEIGFLADFIAVYAIIMVYININEILKRKADTLLSKHRQGLFLPINTRKIIFTYLLLSALIFSVITLAAGLILSSKIGLALLYLLLFVIKYAIDLSLTLANSSYRKVFNTAMLLVYWLLGFVLLV